MYTGALPATSNNEDWEETFQLVDEDTGEPIDLTGRTITLTLRDFATKCVVLTGSTTNGDITVPDLGFFTWFFAADRMTGFCQRQYEVGVRLDSSVQLMICTIDIFDSIDRQ